MSPKIKRFLKKCLSHIGILFFAVAAWMLWGQLKEYSLSDVWAAIAAIPSFGIAAALVLCVAEYLVLSTYDYWALRYVKKKLEWWKWMLAGAMGFAISNNAGHAVVSGGSIRYRLYTRWRIRGGDIVKILTFNGFTYFLGAAFATCLGAMLLGRAEEGFAASRLMHLMLFFTGGGLGGYFLLCAILPKKSIQIFSLKFSVPNLAMAFTQTLTGAADSILAGLVLYSLSANIAGIPGVVEFVAIFVIAQAAGIFAQVPGGIGVFEGVMMFALPDAVDPAAMFGALLAFRVVFFLLPLAGIGGAFFIYEHLLRQKMRNWKIFQIPKHGDR